MSELLCSNIREACIPGVEAWAASAARSRARSNRPRLAYAARTAPPPLRAFRARRYSPDRRPVLCFGLAMIASAVVFIGMVGVPSVLEAERRASRALLHEPTRISTVAALQRDTLLAGACWPYGCALGERR